jgi:hypothetical protein
MAWMAVKSCEGRGGATKKETPLYTGRRVPTEQRAAGRRTRTENRLWPSSRVGCAHGARKTVLQVAESKKSPRDMCRAAAAAVLPDACSCCCCCCCCDCGPSANDTTAVIRAVATSRAMRTGADCDLRAFHRIAGLAKSAIAG